MAIELSKEQINNLARPLVNMSQIINDFYKNAQNEQSYREWYHNKYGRYPTDEVTK